IDGRIRLLEEEVFLDKNKKHTIEIVVDRLEVKGGIETRLTDSLETASNRSGGLVLVTQKLGEKEKEYVFLPRFGASSCQ
ncbi:hypothetical protein LCGC14_1378020, partial [marine sediment metagenome]